MAKKFDWNAPLYCNPHIAVAVGAEAGIVYERLRWMIQDSKGKKTAFGSIREDGRRWVDFTYAQLLEWLPIFKSTKALRDVITKLEKAGLIDSETFPSGKWYTLSNLDPATLTKIVTPETDEICQGDDENRQSRVTKNDTPSDENRQPLIYKESESTSESISEAASDSSSSPAAATPQTLAVEEKESSTASGPILEVDEGLIKAFAGLCKVPVADPKLPHLLHQIQMTDPQVAARDFRAFKMYYEAVRDPKLKDRYETPAPLYVLNGWARFIEWWKSHQDGMVMGYLPGVDDSISLPRWSWVQVADWPVGEGVLTPRWDGLVFYAKQADGTFAEVPRDQWPEWACEPAHEAAV